MEISGPGGGAWTLHVVDGTCHLREEWPTSYDLVMRQSPETFIKTFTGMQKPMLAMLTGKIKVRGLRNLGTFGKLFHPPALNQVLEYNASPVNLS